MARKPETNFRINTVDPALALLPNTYAMSIQQQVIAGDPDKILCINGVFVALELKAKKGSLSPLQEYKLSKIREAGGLAFKVDPMNWKEVHDELLKLAQGGHYDGTKRKTTRG